MVTIAARPFNCERDGRIGRPVDDLLNLLELVTSAWIKFVSPAFEFHASQPSCRASGATSKPIVFRNLN